MILTCPACATRYFVADDVVGASGKAVRCAGCHHRWTAYPEGEIELAATVEDATFVSEPEPEPELPKANAAPRAFRAKVEAKKTMRAAVVNGMIWAGIAGGFALLIGLSIVFRVNVVQLAPRAASAYAAIGLPVNPTGLVFETVSAKPGLQDGHDALVVSGAVRNIEKHPLATPILAIRMLDKTGHAIAIRTADPGAGAILPGQAHAFVVSVLDPPAAANDVELAIAKERKLQTAMKPQPAARPAAAAAAAGPTLRGPADTGPVAVPTKPTPIMELPAAKEAKPLAADSPYALHPANG